MAAKNPLTALFSPPPDQWALRGDPFLWRGMSRAFSKSPFPSTEEQLIGLVEGTFQKLTGARLLDEKSISGDETVFVKRYARGGMSSGQVSMEFWRCSILPLLRSRYRRSRQSMSDVMRQ
jgi:hypothetical protein